MSGTRKQSIQKALAWSLAALAIIAVGCVLHFGRAAFIPIALAILLTLLLWPIVDALHRRLLPRAAAAAFVMLSVVAIAGFTAQAVWTPARAWLDRAPETFAVIERKIRPLAGLVQKLEGVTTRATRLGDAEPERTMQEVVITARRDGVITISRSIAVATVTVLILSFFLLAGGPRTVAHIAECLANRAGATRVLALADAVRRDVSRYVGTVALINLGLGTATALVMAAWGMPSPILWGTMAALLNFIPYVGSAITLLAITAASLVVFDDVGQGIAVGASYLLLTTIEGQLVQPLLVGRRLNISPIAVFLALWFGGWFWGIAGMLLAVPTLVGIKAAATHVPSWNMVAALLGPAPPVVPAQASTPIDEAPLPASAPAAGSTLPAVFPATDRGTAAARGATVPTA